MGLFYIRATLAHFPATFFTWYLSWKKTLVAARLMVRQDTFDEAGHCLDWRAMLVKECKVWAGGKKGAAMLVDAHWAQQAAHARLVLHLLLSSCHLCPQHFFDVTILLQWFLILLHVQISLPEYSLAMSTQQVSNLWTFKVTPDDDRHDAMRWRWMMMALL